MELTDEQYRKIGEKMRSSNWNGELWLGKFTVELVTPLFEQRIKELEVEREGLRWRIHFLEHHNQWFERCESAWCNPSADNHPAVGYKAGTRTNELSYEELKAERDELQRQLDEAQLEIRAWAKSSTVYCTTEQIQKMTEYVLLNRNAPKPDPRVEALVQRVCESLGQNYGDLVEHGREQYRKIVAVVINELEKEQSK